MNRRGLILLSFSIVCIAIIAVGLLYWWSDQVVEQKLQRCIRNLKEESGYIIEEQLFSDFDIDPAHMHACSALIVWYAWKWPKQEG